MASGAPLDDDGGMDKGAIWILTLDTYSNYISNTEGLPSNSMNVYPNPFNEKTIFSYNADNSGETIEFIIEIYNSKGIKVFSTNGVFTSSASTIPIVEWTGKNSDGTMLQKGIYYSVFSFKKWNGEYLSQTRKIIFQ